MVTMEGASALGGEVLWQGSLEAIPLKGVLQALGKTRATGILYVLPIGVSVHFRDGRIQAVAGMVPLGDLLIVQGHVAEEEVVKALDSGPAPLGQALLAQGLDPGVLKESLTAQAKLSLALLLHHATGQGFSFATGKPLPSPEAGLEVSPLLLEWAMKAHPLPLGTPVELAPNSGPTLHLDPEDWRLIRLVNGRRTLANILRFSGLDPQVAWRRAEILIQRGLVRPSALWGLRLIVPERAPTRTNYHPPSSLTANLFLKWVDGTRSAATITQILRLQPQEGATYLVDLYREGLIEAKYGRTEMERLLEEF